MKSFLERFRGTTISSCQACTYGINRTGSFLGILAIERIGFWLEISGFEYLFLIGSFGASAVLLYGAPMTEFSQPRNVIGGHVISTLVGVSLYKFFGPQSMWICPLAVSLAIFAQQLTRTIHPPGGATPNCGYWRGCHLSTWFSLCIFTCVCGINNHGAGCSCNQ